MRQSLVILVIAIIAVASGVVAALYATQFGAAKDEVIKLSWHKMGGIAGVSEELIVEVDGSVSYYSDRFVEATLVLTKEEVEDLIDKADFFTVDRSYRPKPGAADYFIYRLTIHTTSGLKMLVWVDASVSEETLPSELSELQLHLESIVNRMRSQDDYQNAIRLARDFIVQAPTFKFDGIPGTLKVTGSVSLESFPVQYVITIAFDSRHAGYGDRTNQILVQVITPHEAVVKVVSDNVVSAILDGIWDELNQQPIEDNIMPYQGIISGQVSIGPLCPVEPCQAQPDIYTSRQIVLTPQVGSPIHIRLGSDGSFEAKVIAGTYIVDLTDCTYVGCGTALPKTVTIEPNTAIMLPIVIDTGIR